MLTPLKQNWNLKKAGWLEAEHFVTHWESWKELIIYKASFINFYITYVVCVAGGEKKMIWFNVFLKKKKAEMLVLVLCDRDYWESQFRLTIVQVLNSHVKAAPLTLGHLSTHWSPLSLQVSSSLSQIFQLLLTLMAHAEDMGPDSVALVKTVHFETQVTTFAKWNIWTSDF